MNDSGLQQWENSDTVIEVNLEKDQILQKFLARRISHERQLRIVLTTDDVVEGFITGFDEDGWFQVSSIELSQGRESSRDVLIRGSSIVLIEETGKGLREMSDLSQARIRDYSYALKKSCERAVSKGPRRNNYNEEAESVTQVV